MSFDCYGKLVPAIATSWEANEDSTVWTFHLRDDVDWVDCNGEVKEHITATDFLVGLEWVLNASKNEANNTSMPTLYIVGAEEYYEKTKDMGAAAADLHYQDMLDAGVGLEAPDDYTLVFTCKDPCPYFDTVASYTSFYPASQALIDELGIETFRGCDNTNMWYCGPYIVEEYIQGNTKSYIPNPHYYNAANVSRFERMTVTMISDQAIAFQLYQNRELDEMDLNESTITTITSDPNNEYNSQLCEKRARPTAYAMHFNYQKNNADGTPDVNWNKAIANTAFRQCFYRGLNLKAWFSRYNKINPLKCENDYYTMKGLCYNTQGVEYTTLVAKEMGFDAEKYDGETMIRLRANGGDISALKKQAMEELSAIGVTFPVKATYFIIASSTSALDNATILKQCFSDSFGDDFIKLDVQTYVSSLTQEVRTPQLQSFVINGWSADFGDPVNFLGQETLHDDNAFYSHYYSNIARVAEAPADYQKDLMDAFEQYTDLVNAGNTVAQDNATVLKQCFIDSFGDDFIQLDLGTYVSSLAKEVRIPKLHGFVINGWGADFGDPVNFVGQEILHDSNAYYAVNYSNIQLVAEDPADYQKELVDEFEQFTDLVNAANAIVDDTDARYEAFAKAEAYMINNSLAVPCYYDVRWCLTHVNEYTKINAMFGPCNLKYVNWETSEDAYTTAQYEEFAKAFDAAKS